MPETPDLSALSAEYRRQWRDFALWCQASNLPALPTGADTVHAYLAEQHGAAVSSQRARVAAINAVHRLAGHPLPGRAESVRRALNPDRTSRLSRAQLRVHELLPDLATTGWPGGLFGRRDAAMLVLAAAGLSFTTLADLRQRELRVDDDAVTIGAQPLLVLPATGDPHRCPVIVLRRWAAVVVLAPHAAASFLLEHHLNSDDPISTTRLRPEHEDLPVLTGFDHRGTPLALPGRLAPLSAAHIATLAAAHHAGRAPTRKRTPPPTPTAAPTPAPPPDIQLDPGYYAAGVAARHRARDIGSDLDELFDRLDREATAALERSNAALNAAIGHTSG
ncbi:hypothetical protein [Nocardia sp. NPDC052566]|uniref:hypothetical protein n=1 Tax=Nocardia sp. NPDC052566 TaxID=3364330 RepID=UPI0037C604A6